MDHPTLGYTENQHNVEFAIKVNQTRAEALTRVRDAMSRV